METDILVNDDSGEIFPCGYYVLVKIFLSKFSLINTK